MNILLQKDLRVHARLVRVEYDVAQCDIFSTEGSLYRSGDMYKHDAESWVENTAQDLGDLLADLAEAATLKTLTEISLRKGIFSAAGNGGEVTVTLHGDRDLVLYKGTLTDQCLTFSEWSGHLYAELDRLISADMDNF